MKKHHVRPLGFLTFAVCGVLLCALALQVRRYGPKYDSIDAGMSASDVQAILGPPTWSGSRILVENEGQWIEASKDTWMGSDESIDVAFDRDGRVCYKSYDCWRKSWLERLRGWLGL